MFAGRGDCRMGKLVSGLEYKLFITRDTVNGLNLILIEYVKSRNTKNENFLYRGELHTQNEWRTLIDYAGT